MGGNELPDEKATGEIATQLVRMADFVSDPSTNGFSACTCKHHLFLIKTMLDEMYSTLPKFEHQEENWEKDWEHARIISILKTEESQ